MRARILALSSALLLLAPLALRAAENPVCGENDLTFGCTRTDEAGRLRAGCGVHEGGRFFPSEWRIYHLETEKILAKAAAGPDGIALVEMPDKLRWFVLEGELHCKNGEGSLAVPYRFLVERTGRASFAQRAYSPETLVATGNWNADVQLNYGAFRSRSLNAAGAPER
ncbi:MAG: hypothetical protein ACJ75H_20560 [Thermoanaerobaculia bacterium]